MIRLKMDNGKRFMKKSAVKVFAMFLMLVDSGVKGQNQYVDSFLMFLSDYEEWSLPSASAAQKKVVEMIHENLSCFNEEAGEIAFSILARLIMDSSRRVDIGLCAQQFKLLKSHIASCNQLEVDIGFAFGKGKHAGHVEIEAADVATTKQFLIRMIKACKTNKFRVYGKGFEKAKTGALARSMPDSVPLEPAPRLFRCTKQLLKDLVGKTTKRVSQFWLHQFKHIWPAASPNPLNQGDWKSESDEESDSAMDRLQAILDAHEAKKDGAGGEGGKGGPRDHADHDVKRKGAQDDHQDGDGDSHEGYSEQDFLNDNDDRDEPNVDPPADANPVAVPKKRAKKKRAIKKKAPKKKKQKPEPVSDDDVEMKDDEDDDPVHPNPDDELGRRRSGRRRNEHNWEEFDDPYDGFRSSADDEEDA